MPQNVKMLSKLFFTAAALFFLSTAQANSVLSVDLKESLRLALEKNLDIKISETSLLEKTALTQKAKGEFDYTLSGSATKDHSETPSSSSLDGVTSVVTSNTTSYKPTLKTKTAIGTDLSLAYNYTSSESNSSYNRYPIGHTTSLALNASQPLIKGFANGYIERNLLKAEIDFKSAQSRHKEKVETIILKVAEMYFDLKRDQELLKLSEVSLESAKANETSLNAKLAQGQASKIEAAEGQSARLKSYETYINAKANLKSKLEEFSLLLTGEIYETIQLVGSETEQLEKPDGKEKSPDLEKIIESRNEYKTQLLAYEKSEKEYMSAQTDLYPSVNLEASLTQKGLGEDLSEANDDISKRLHSSWSVGLKFDSPIYRHASKSALHSKRLQLEQEKIKLNQVRNEIELELRKARRDQNLNWQRYSAISLAAQAQSLKMNYEQAKFGQGKTSINDLNRSRVEYETTVSEKVKAVNSFLKAKLRYRVNLGQSLEELVK